MTMVLSHFKNLSLHFKHSKGLLLYLFVDASIVVLLYNFAFFAGFRATLYQNQFILHFPIHVQINNVMFLLRWAFYSDTHFLLKSM